jgi:hypothetical protein
MQLSFCRFAYNRMKPWKHVTIRCSRPLQALFEVCVEGASVWTGPGLVSCCKHCTSPVTFHKTSLAPSNPPVFNIFLTDLSLEMAHPEGVNTVEGRLATFNAAHPAKRRASTTRKRAAATLAWPHDSPTPDDVWIPSPSFGYSILC